MLIDTERNTQMIKRQNKIYDAVVFLVGVGYPEVYFGKIKVDPKIIPEKVLSKVTGHLMLKPSQAPAIKYCKLGSEQPEDMVSFVTQG